LYHDPPPDSRVRNGPGRDLRDCLAREHGTAPPARAAPLAGLGGAVGCPWGSIRTCRIRLFPPGLTRESTVGRSPRDTSALGFCTRSRFGSRSRRYTSFWAERRRKDHAISNLGGNPTALRGRGVHRWRTDRSSVVPRPVALSHSHGRAARWLVGARGPRVLRAGRGSPVPRRGPRSRPARDPRSEREVSLPIERRTAQAGLDRPDLPPRAVDLSPRRTDRESRPEGGARDKGAHPEAEPRKDRALLFAQPLRGARDRPLRSGNQIGADLPLRPHRERAGLALRPWDSGAPAFPRARGLRP